MYVAGQHDSGRFCMHKNMVSAFLHHVGSVVTCVNAHMTFTRVIV